MNRLCSNPTQKSISHFLSSGYRKRPYYQDRSLSPLNVASCCSYSTGPIIELREYELKPEYAAAYLKTTAEYADLRKSYVPLRFFSVPETGGQLSIATHAYYYAGGHSERDEKRGILGANHDWQTYIGICRPYAQVQSSSIWTEAPMIQELQKEYPTTVLGLAPDPTTLLEPSKSSVLEFRRYKLKLGYDTVPKFLDYYSKGIPSKLNAEGHDPMTSLVSVMYTEVGRLNEVIEIWRHGNGAVGMEICRNASRSAPEWRKAIAQIADEVALEFTTTIHKPTNFSPMQ